jgi:hypothetical protein
VNSVPPYQCSIWKKENKLKRGLLVCIPLLLLFLVPCHAGFLDTVRESVSSSQGTQQDDSTIASGLKEALSIGTENAVNAVSQTDGYFGNSLIKILMPKNLQKVADVLGKVGYQKQVDEFLLSMNRAAEKAAPQAASIFGDAVKEMTLQDARGILGGGRYGRNGLLQGKDLRPHLYGVQADHRYEFE